MATDIAVAWWFAVLAGRLKFKDFKIGAKVATIKPQFFQNAPGVDIEVFAKPVILANPRSELVNELASDDVHKKVVSLVNRGSCETDVFGAAKAWNTHRCGCVFFTHVSIVSGIIDESKVFVNFFLQMDTFDVTVKERKIATPYKGASGYAPYEAARTRIPLG